MAITIITCDFEAVTILISKVLTNRTFKVQWTVIIVSILRVWQWGRTYVLTLWLLFLLMKCILSNWKWRGAKKSVRSKMEIGKQTHTLSLSLFLVRDRERERNWLHFTWYECCTISWQKGPTNNVKIRKEGKTVS